MERKEVTFDVDTIKYHHNDWDALLIREGTEVLERSVFADTLDLNGNVSVQLDEYFTYIRGDMKVTVSYAEHNGEEFERYTDDYQIESVEVFE